MAKSEKDKKNSPGSQGEPKVKGDEKKSKKQLDTWSYYLAWFAFACGVGAACLKVIKEWNPPTKDEHYKK